MSGSDGQLNEENISSRYSKVLLLNVEPNYSCAKENSLVIMCDCPDKDTKFTKVSMCVKLLQ